MLNGNLLRCIVPAKGSVRTYIANRFAFARTWTILCAAWTVDARRLAGRRLILPIWAFDTGTAIQIRTRRTFVEKVCLAIRTFLGYLSVRRVSALASIIVLARWTDINFGSCTLLARDMICLAVFSTDKTIAILIDQILIGRDFFALPCFGINVYFKCIVALFCSAINTPHAPFTPNAIAQIRVTVSILIRVAFFIERWPRVSEIFRTSYITSRRRSRRLFAVSVIIDFVVALFTLKVVTLLCRVPRIQVSRRYSFTRTFVDIAEAFEPSPISAVRA